MEKETNRMFKLLRRILALTMTMLTLCPVLAEGYDGHLLLSEMNEGTCTTLTDEVEVVVVFVSVDGEPWTDEGIAAMQAELLHAAATLEQEAAGYGAALSMTLNCHETRAASAATLQDSAVWAGDVLATLPELFYADFTNTPLIFCISTEGRAFAHCEYLRTGTEYLCLYRGDSGATFRHELMHLYGAWDYYLPQDVTAAAQQHCPDSIMLAAEPASRTDSLTAYIAGWTDAPDAAARSLLDATAHVTQAMIDTAQDMNQYTGYTTVQTDEGVYTGMLQDGLMHGFGEMRWNDGSSYTGQWRWHVMHGQGVYTWADGSSYTGSYVEGEKHGSGTQVWADGSSYTGQFVHGRRTGQGIFTWADGSSYTGSFQDDVFSGKGVLTWNDGSWYAGDFLNDQRTGSGMMVWPGGTSYTGDFQDGMFHGQGTFTWPTGDWYRGDFAFDVRSGQGTYHWADGSSYTGEFLNGMMHGQGVYRWPDGTVLEGLWQYGEFAE